ncbi:integrase core domain-containing protein [Halobacterium hubeiense]
MLRRRCRSMALLVLWSVREWLEQFMHYYNHHRPHQALDGKTPIEVVQN